MNGGGGGGGGGGGWRSSHLSRGSSDAAASDAAAASEYEAEANGFLQDLLASFNDRDAERIQERVDTLLQAIEKDIEGEASALFGGSIKKHTYVDGLSDVDVLVVVNESSLADGSPQAVLRYFAERVQSRFPDVEVKAGALAVTVKYADGTEIQLLPALRTSTGVRIAAADGSGWSDVVRPQEFARKLTQVNQACGRKVVPVIKLFRGLQASLPETNQIKNYHAESLAIEAFRDYSGRQTYKEMLHFFLRNSARRVLAPISDSTGQSRHVDDYLGAADSTARVRVSKALDRLATRFDTADARSSLDTLRDLFAE